MNKNRQKTIDDDYELPNQPVWQNEQLVRFHEIADKSQQSNIDDNEDLLMEGMTMSQAVQSWEDSLKVSGRQGQDQMRAVYQIVQQASSSNSSTSQPPKQSFDPATHHFSPDELKPTPIQRKSRKTLVREEDKDEKYWDKRKKNNLAAKRSREARRSRENQISLRASYLEKDNAQLKEELLSVKEELQSLRETLLVAQQQSDMQQSKNGLLNNNWRKYKKTRSTSSLYRLTCQTHNQKEK